MSKKPTWEDIGFYVLFPFKRVLVDTMDVHSDSKSSWLSPSVWLGYLRACVFNSYPRNNLKECLTYRKMLEWERAVLWIYLAAFSGAYESIGRELRFLVQDMSQAIVIDNDCKTSNLEDKVEKIPNRIKQDILVNKLRISEEVKGNLKDNWKVLCGYVHPSREIVRTAITESKFIFTLIESQFKDLLRIFSETMDLFFSVLLEHFPKAIESYLEHNTGNNIPMKYEFYHNEYWNTLKMCRKHCPESFDDPYFGYYDYPDISEYDEY